jgi:hypothetical protein
MRQEAREWEPNNPVQHDGVELDCDAKTLEAKRFVNWQRSVVH